MQNYKNHRRFNPLHHFFLLPVTLGLFIWSIVSFESNGDEFKESLYFLLSSFALLFTSLMSRMYATKNQDRIIRMEMRLLYFQLAGNTFSEKEKHLTTPQIVALRFASDEELLLLIDRAISEKLSSKQIKLAIKDWKGDYSRV